MAAVGKERVPRVGEKDKKNKEKNGFGQTIKNIFGKGNKSKTPKEAGEKGWYHLVPGRPTTQNENEKTNSDNKNVQVKEVADEGHPPTAKKTERPKGQTVPGDSLPTAKDTQKALNEASRALAEALAKDAQTQESISRIDGEIIEMVKARNEIVKASRAELEAADLSTNATTVQHLNVSPRSRSRMNRNAAANPGASLYH